MGWYERMQRWAEAHRFGVDITATLVLGLPAAALSWGFAGGGVLFDLSWWSGRASLVLTLALIVPLAWRRVRPVHSTAVIAVVAVAHVVVGVPMIFPADLAILVALYSVTVNGPVWAHRAALATAMCGAGLLGLAVLRAGQWSSTYLDQAVTFSVFAAIAAFAAWAFGLVRRSRREMLETLRDRARRLEIERDQQAQIATAAERARIARELHDIVAHSLSVVIAQADGGRYAAASDPDAAGRSLGVIAETGRAALADMRRLLGVLRSDDGPGGGRAPRAPQPGMRTAGATTGGAAPPSADGAGGIASPPDDASLESLLDQARAAGARVSFVRVGDPRRLPPGAGLTLHRVCQEALTNVRKHAGPDVSVTVVMRWSRQGVELEVSDDGRGAAGEDAPGAAPGYGLLGMRERATLFGGTVTAGPRPGGGWRVRFTLPLPPDARDGDPAPDVTDQTTAQTKG
ncbi:sensor histidine kinase [Xylanimonas allomyrinae]|uniref:histidine kinase n=1 Tax=Xylanimonas allomyrinae TaxID=2509459 RepID=A0A4P6ENV2_9MICO|nr:sensor histidine kinase [Xylanimonas allomyrinae]QAY63413.1 sensor histidine kinase [Xylanimonas allomyrinae]